MERGKVSRRTFFFLSAAGASSALLAPRLRGYAANEKLIIAGVGVGGMGRNYIREVSSEKIAFLCDVDDTYAGKTYKRYPKAKRYRAFRKMLESEKSIDAVVIGTPDHTHATIAYQAMRMGKHVYCAKPLTRTVYEARRLAEVAKETGVATQMSVQGDATESHRLLAEWILAGAIGPVREVHIWSNRPIWPQGIGRPAGTPPVPGHIDWDLFIGPAPMRPYHPAYHPFKFRGWWDFGTGALGDMGCHGFNPIFKALKLGHPRTVEAETSKPYPETAPRQSTVRYTFAARGEMPPVALTWYDGGRKPPRPPELERGRRFGANFGGILFVGDNGKIVCDGLGGSPRLIPESAMKAFQRPPKFLRRSMGHYKEWIAACKGGKPAGCHFPFGALLTEAVLLGNVAIRAQKKLRWDPVTLSFPGNPDADRLLRDPYRDGWHVEGLG